jgi:polyhydroxyalkanoate synthesis regulator phasin
MIIDDLRKILEAVVGTLTPTKAQQMAKEVLEPGAAKEQVAKTAADLLEWSHTNRERLSTFVRREISDQLKSLGGVATQAELDALKKRVRDLERAAGKSASPKASSRKPASRKSASRTPASSTAKKVTRPPAPKKRAASRAATGSASGARTAASAARGSASPSTG